MSRLLAVLSGMALLLSLMAIYSVTAFTVVQRTREIGVRVALGAGRWRIVAPIIGRPLLQIGLGIVAGTGLVVLAFVGLFESTPTPLEAGHDRRLRDVDAGGLAAGVRRPHPPGASSGAQPGPAI